MVEGTTLKSGCLASLVPLLTSQNMDWVTIDPTDDGWHIQSLSVDKVVMIDVLFDGFDGYAPTGPFVLSMEDFKRIASLSGGCIARHRTQDRLQGGTHEGHRTHRTLQV